MTDPIPIDDHTPDGVEGCAGELFFNLCELSDGHPGHHRAHNEDGEMSWNPDMWGDG
ncbi:hypothetical protein [Curtobacterium sp. Leaf261]|uniref:hypothetical protein n=1 Tax=Curtobacterium sp. Leaf261 TaxID=1736311 RepID=UPI000AEE7221|nr:hypothetical protein [Curtobacterium sp. Leaf261]